MKYTENQVHMKAVLVIVKTYKSMGGRYADDNKPTNLKRWFEEK